ncbi:MAG: phage protease [Dysgonomonas sp.]|uniref:phage protease n=1 Tax=Dysgonomonas sp. TaxID=1891233 RepID=UPI003A8AA42D
MAFKKIEKEYCLTDNSVNCYGYRLLTEGFLQDRFSPAIGYLMHNREGGVAVKWEDFRIDGDKLWAKPVINTAKYPNLADEIEAGFYDAASVGHLIALEWTDNESMKLAGQTGITVTKWFCRECSIVDIPGNFNALAKLYDDNDSMLMDLSDNRINNNPKFEKNDMDKIVLTGAMLAGLNLMAGATQADAEKALSDLAAKASRTEKAEKDLADLKAEHNKKAVEDILQKGKDEGRLTKELADELGVTYKENPEGLKNLVAKMPKQTRVTGKETEDLSGIPEKYRGKTKQELFVSGQLESLKAECPEYFEQLMKGDK